MKAIGASLGIDFKNGGKTGSTRLSHRLIHLAGTPSKTTTSSQNAATTPTRSQHLALQNRVVTELFKGYFEEEADITDISVLVDVGVKAGMDTIGLSEVEIRRYLESEEGGKEVDRQAMEARLAGVSGVPNFVINGVYEVGGAQDVDVFLDVFEKIGSGWEKA
jgi:predicted DsbA family dithiol-disulfide isomerase